MSDATPPQASTTLDQQRAAHALTCIRKLAEQDPGQYVSYVSSLPATIVTNGLGQALATELAKKEEAHCELYKHVAGWLCKQIDELAGDSATLLDRLMINDQQVYLRAQVEAMAYLNWLKQFARAYLNEKEGQPR